MKLCWSLFIIFSLTTFVQAEEFKVHVQSFDPEIDVRELKSDKVEPMKSPIRKPGHFEDLPSPKEMDQIFKEAGLGPEVLEMEQMDKDLFYLKVQKKPMEYLKRKYPDISATKIKKLKSMIEVKL